MCETREFITRLIAVKCVLKMRTLMQKKLLIPMGIRRGQIKTFTDERNDKKRMLSEGEGTI